MKYRFVEHTADIAVEVYGENFEELVKNATLAFRDAFVYQEKLEGELEREIEVEVEGDSEEEVYEYALYDWLNELLYCFDAEHFAPRECDVKAEWIEKDLPKKLRVAGRLKGGKLRSEAVKVEPKAVTLHNFRVERCDGLKAFVVFDI